MIAWFITVDFGCCGCLRFGLGFDVFGFGCGVGAASLFVCCLRVVFVVVMVIFVNLYAVLLFIAC